MHKNSYNAKSLIGNWHENRYTEDYNRQHNATSNTFLQNPCKSTHPHDPRSPLLPCLCLSLQQVCPHRSRLR